MSEEVDWKEKYRALVEQHEHEELDRAETEKLLCRTIVRLTLATAGLDSNLDPTLRKIRNALRHGVSPSLKKTLTSLSDALMHAGEQQVQESGGEPQPDLFQRLLDRTRLSGNPARRLKQLSSQLMADPASVTDEQLDELLALIVPEAPPAAAGPGLFGRLFGREPAAAPGSPAEPNRVLLRLLEKLNWPGHLAADMAALMERLGPGSGSGAWIAVLEDFGGVVTSALADVQTEIRATESFLSDLTVRLQELDRHMSGSQSMREASSKSGRELNDAVKGEVGQIRHSISIATDMAELKANIARRLDTIQGHIDHHLQEERKRQKKAERTEQALRKRLYAMQKEAGSLRTKMAEAKSKALEDPLTGLPNRLAYEERLANEFARWKRSGKPLALLVWDVDDFKQINDRFGHQAGDKALGVIGRILSRRPRETDFVGRYGGEEFVMLLVDSPIENTRAVAEEIRQDVANSGFHSSANERVAVTISCGISEFREGDNPEAVFKRADEAMYQAKRNGKNRIVVI